MLASRYSLLTGDEKLKVNQRARQWALLNPDKIRVSQRKSEARPERKLWHKLYRQSRPEAQRIYRQRYREKLRVAGSLATLDRKYNLKGHYKMSPEDYNALLKAQNGLCAICERPNRDRRIRRLHIDHDHVTGEVRGLLCSTCNTALGLLAENAEYLKRAITYLKGELKC